MMEGAPGTGDLVEDEREAVEGVIPVVHEHLDVPQDAGGEAEVLHVVEVGIEALGEAAQGEGLAHAGACGKETDAPCLKISYVEVGTFLAEAPLIPILIFMLAIWGIVAFAHYLGWRNIREINLAEVSRDDTMM